MLGRKLGMTQVFDEQRQHARRDGDRGGAATVTQVKTAEKDGYDAIQLGFGAAKRGATSRCAAT